MAAPADTTNTPRIPRLAVEERYYRDSSFRAYIDLLTAAIDRLDLTPTEVRELAVYSCIRHEMRIMREAIRYMPRGDGEVRSAELPRDTRDQVMAHVRELEAWLGGFSEPEAPGG